MAQLIADRPRTGDEPAWHALDRSELEANLGTGAGGLSRVEAQVRLTRYGPNQIEAESRPSDSAILLRQVQSPLVVILIVAGVVTALLGEYLDAIVIAAVVVLNTAIGFIQERQAERSVHALLQLLTPHARVVRDSEHIEVESRELVPGDLVLLESGVRVPADIRLTATTGLQVDESTLTGESVPAFKRWELLPAEVGLADRVNLAHAGTTVASGRGRGYVVATGRQTELGAIAGEMRAVRRAATPLQQRMDRLTRLISVVVLGCAVVAFVVGLAGGRSITEMFLIAVALAVSAVPEGLPIAFTVTLAVGVRRMAHRRAIIRHLPSVETLGSTTVIGSDKTGTLTENAMTVREVWAAGEHFRMSEVASDDPPSPRSPCFQTLLAGVLTNEALVSRTEDGIEAHGDPTETALLIAAMDAGIAIPETRQTYRLVAELPFEPERQYSASLRAHDETYVLCVKGAPRRVLGMCSRMLIGNSVAPLDQGHIEAATHAMASRGLRVLAMASCTLPDDSSPLEELVAHGDLTFLGIQGLADPPRAGAREAIATCRQAGIRVVMITGDHAVTAGAIGHELGIVEGDDAPLTGIELDKLDDAALAERVSHVQLYARVAPEHKLRIVKALQRQGEVVAVTGDGVNDAPALRAADIGVAMGKRGTDVAKEAADMVLTDDNFVSIASAVEEGRITFDNLRKVVFFLFSTNVAEIMTILVALALGWPLPLVAAQILWLNLVTDSLPVIALAFEPGEPDAMARRPYGRNAGILSPRLWERLGLSSVVMTIGTLAVFRWELDQTGSLVTAQTVALTTMVLYQMFQALNARSETRSLLRLNPLSNRLLLLAIVAAVGLHIAALHLSPTQRLLRVEPISVQSWLLAVIVAAMIVIAVELHKRLRR